MSLETLEQTDLKQQIEEVAKPLWEKLIADNPQLVTEEEMTFEEFCDEIRWAL